MKELTVKQNQEIKKEIVKAAIERVAIARLNIKKIIERRPK